MFANETLQALINEHSNDALAEQDGMVYQVWQDGEITLTKSGSLLGQRNLHCVECGVNGFEIKGVVWPHVRPNGNKFIYTTHEGAKAIRNCIFDAVEARR